MSFEGGEDELISMHEMEMMDDILNVEEGEEGDPPHADKQHGRGSPAGSPSSSSRTASSSKGRHRGEAKDFDKSSEEDTDSEDEYTEDET
eukprot:6968595-Pyramimonas_sp.AAC.1